MGCSIAKICAARQPQHVIQRGNNREAIFGAVADYRFYLEKLHAAANKQRREIHAYVLMTNHVPLLLTPHTKDEIGKVMQTLGRYRAEGGDRTSENHRYRTKINRIRPY